MRRHIVMLVALLSSVVFAESITGTGPQKYNTPGEDHSNHMQSTMYCGNSPESWVHGSGWLDTASGVVSLTIQLETDANDAGPKGKLLVTIKDGQGKLLYTGTSSEVAMGGKPPGKAIHRDFSTTVALNPAVTATAKSLTVEAQCTGPYKQIWSIPLSAAVTAFKIILTAAH